MFEMTKEEFDNRRSQNMTSNWILGHCHQNFIGATSRFYPEIAISLSLSFAVTHLASHHAVPKSPSSKVL